MSNDSISKKDLLSYGVLAIPLSFAGIPLYMHAPDFYATQFNVSLGSLGFVLLILRFIDALQDTVIGYFSDRYAQYRPIFMLIAGILLIMGFALLFKPLSSSYLLWFTIFVFISSVAFSILFINLNTIGGIWSTDKNQKTIIAGYRETFGLIGLILAVTLPALLQNNMPKIQAFEYISLTLFVIMAICGSVFWQWQKKHPYLNINQNKKLIITKKSQFISYRTKRFFIIYGVSMLASSIPAVLVLFFIRDQLGLENYTGLFLLSYLLSGAIGIPLWQNISRRFDKYKAWLMAMVLAVLSFIWACFLTAGDLWEYLTICILSGIAFGAELVLPTAILADHIHHENKEDQASFHYGILAFLANLSLAVVAAVSLSFLDMLGFTPAGQNKESVLLALSLSYSAVPSCIKLLSIYLLWVFINDKKTYITNGDINHVKRV